MSRHNSDSEGGSSASSPPEREGGRRSSRCAGPGAVLLISVEEYFQARAFREYVGRGEWKALPSRVHRNVDRLLELLEHGDAKATFFVHRWPAEQHPDMVRRIADADHEVAVLGGCGSARTVLPGSEFAADLRETRRTLQNLSGRSVVGHRTDDPHAYCEEDWFFETLAEQGFAYDASVPFRPPWGRADWGERCVRHRVEEVGRTVWELSVSCLRVFGVPVLPASGTVLRFLPPSVVGKGLRESVNGRVPAVFHMHSWEIDPHQPTLSVAPLDRIRQYGRLEEAADRLGALLAEMSFTSVASELEFRRPARDEREEADDLPAVKGAEPGERLPPPKWASLS